MCKPRKFLFLQCFDTVGWVIWPVKPVPDMTYNVLGGTLNLAQSIYPIAPATSEATHTYSWFIHNLMTVMMTLMMPVSTVFPSRSMLLRLASTLSCALEVTDSRKLLKWDARTKSATQTGAAVTLRKTWRSITDLRQPTWATSSNEDNDLDVMLRYVIKKSETQSKYR